MNLLGFIGALYSGFRFRVDTLITGLGMFCYCVISFVLNFTLCIGLTFDW